MALKDKPDNRQVDKYMYKLCPKCGIKLNVFAYDCCECGTRTENKTYGSNNPNDAIFSYILNSIEKCIGCPNAQQGRMCRYSYCFGTGKGKCKDCSTFEAVKFNCCQKAQIKER